MKGEKEKLEIKLSLIQFLFSAWPLPLSLSAVRLPILVRSNEQTKLWTVLKRNSLPSPTCFHCSVRLIYARGNWSSQNGELWTTHSQTHCKIAIGNGNMENKTQRERERKTADRIRLAADTMTARVAHSTAAIFHTETVLVDVGGAFIVWFVTQPSHQQVSLTVPRPSVACLPDRVDVHAALVPLRFDYDYGERIKNVVYGIFGDRPDNRKRYKKNVAHTIWYWRRTSSIHS